EAQAVRLDHLLAHLLHLARLRVNAVDCLLDLQLALVPRVVRQAAVAGIGEPDAAVGVDRAVVGRIEPFALPPVGEHGDLARVLVAHDAPVAVLERNLPALPVERVAVGVAGRIAEHADVAVLVQPAELDVVRDVAPDQVPADAAPRRTLGPEHAGVQALDRRVGRPCTSRTACPGPRCPSRDSGPAARPADSLAASTPGPGPPSRTPPPRRETSGVGAYWARGTRWAFPA